MVAALTPGAGASTLAAALHGVDGGVWRGGPVDVLVVRAGSGAPPAGVPVVVLVADGPVSAPGRPGAPVVLPVVPRWSGPDGHRAAADLLRVSEARTPAALRPAAAALRAVVAALLGSGVLERPCAGPAGAPGAPGPGPDRRLRVAPVLLHRATPVVPRLVAGAPLRWRSAPAGPEAVEPRPVRPRALRPAPGAPAPAGPALRTG